MNNSFVTEAINLKSYPFSETDRIMVMYSKEKGLIKGLAKGVKKPKSKLGGRMDALVVNRLMLAKGKNLDIITQAESLNTFYKSRVDMDKLFYSMYCAEVVMNFGVENDTGSEDIFYILYGALKQISESESKEKILLCVIRFQLKIMNVLGYALGLEYCTVCGCEIAQENIYFSSICNGVVCQNCKNDTMQAKKMNLKLQQFLKTLANTDYKEMTIFDELATESICLFFFKILQEHIQNFSPKKFKSSTILATV